MISKKREERSASDKGKEIEKKERDNKQNAEPKVKAKRRMNKKVKKTVH